MSIYLARNEDVVPAAGQPKIREVRAYVSRPSEYGASDVHQTADSHWIQGLTDEQGTWDYTTTHPPIPPFTCSLFSIISCGCAKSAERVDQMGAGGWWVGGVLGST